MLTGCRCFIRGRDWSGLVSVGCELRGGGFRIVGVFFISVGLDLRLLKD